MAACNDGNANHFLIIILIIKMTSLHTFSLTSGSTPFFATWLFWFRYIRCTHLHKVCVLTNQIHNIVMEFQDIHTVYQVNQKDLKTNKLSFF